MGHLFYFGYVSRPEIALHKNVMLWKKDQEMSMLDEVKKAVEQMLIPKLSILFIH